MQQIVIIGAGPAGLMAAEQAARAGHQVHVFEAKPGPGRKFLVAGKSGLNLTNTAAWDDFKKVYSGTKLPRKLFDSILDDFDAQALRQWVASLGLDTFSVRSGKVFPRPMKAAPLLRAWLRRLEDLGVRLHTRHQWTGLTPAPLTLHFKTPGGPVSHHADRAILALGGASWPKTGSTGSWTQILAEHGIASTPFEAANCGWDSAITPAFHEQFHGTPLKNLRVSAGGRQESGELMITRYGFEGTPLYALGPELRHQSQPEIEIDFKPMFSHEVIARKMESVRRDFLKNAGTRLKLSEASQALIASRGGPIENLEQFVQAVKYLKVPLSQTRPIEEAISSAGGVAWHELSDSLEFKKLPGLYACGEMLDWEAPTGGFLLQACLATGHYVACS